MCHKDIDEMEQKIGRCHSPCRLEILWEGGYNNWWVDGVKSEGGNNHVRVSYELEYSFLFHVSLFLAHRFEVDLTHRLLISYVIQQEKGN